MQYSMSIDYLTKTMDMAAAANLLAENDFTAVDYSPKVSSEDWERCTQSDLAALRGARLTVFQTHAPFNRYGGYGERHRELVARGLEITARMGARYMVVHGDEFSGAPESWSPAAALAFNHDYFLPTVERAKSYGIGVAFENVFNDGLPTPRNCSDIEQLLSLVRSFDTGNVSVCWDFGHAQVAFGEAHPQRLAEVAPLVSCTHVHDNNGAMDLHIPPFLGKVDWKACVAALKEADYKGTWNFELVAGKIPSALAPDFLRALRHAGELIWEE